MNVSLVNPKHPICRLSFVVMEQDVSVLGPELTELLKNLSGSRSWVIAPPQLFEFHESDEQANLQKQQIGNEPNYPLEGYLDMYSGLEQFELPAEIDRRHFEETTELIHLLERFSIKHGLTIEFYLDSELIGEIVCGLQDKLLRVGLLDQWQQALEVGT